MTQTTIDKSRIGEIASDTATLAAAPDVKRYQRMIRSLQTEENVDEVDRLGRTIIEIDIPWWIAVPMLTAWSSAWKRVSGGPDKRDSAVTHKLMGLIIW